VPHGTPKWQICIICHWFFGLKSVERIWPTRTLLVQVEFEIFYLHEGLSPSIDSLDHIHDLSNVGSATWGSHVSSLWSNLDDHCGWGISTCGVGHTFGQVKNVYLMLVPFWIDLNLPMIAIKFNYLNLVLLVIFPWINKGYVYILEVKSNYSSIKIIFTYFNEGLMWHHPRAKLQEHISTWYDITLSTWHHPRAKLQEVTYIWVWYHIVYLTSSIHKYCIIALQQVVFVSSPWYFYYKEELGFHCRHWL
jgi:hypothetical protein